MKHTLIFVAVLLGITATASAQSASQYMTIQECMKFALENQYQVLNAQLDVDKAQAQANEIRGLGLPQVKVNANVVNNPQLQRFFFDGGNQFIAGGNPNLVPGEVYSSENFFQLKNSGSASIEASQLLFNGSYIVGLQAAKTYRELSEKNVTRTEIQTIEAVGKAYYLVLINEERLVLIESNLSRLDSLLRETKALWEAGFVEKIDVDRIEVAYNNLNTQKYAFQNQKDVAMNLLKFQMGYPQEDSLRLNATIKELNMEQELVPAEGSTSEQRVEYTLLQYQRRLESLNLKNTRFTGIPTIAAFGTYGATRQDNNFGGLFTGDWYPYSMIGLTASWDLFTGTQRIYKAQQSKIAVKQIDNQIQLFEQSYALEVKSAQVTYDNAIKIVDDQKKNLSLATEVTRVTKVKYQSGVGSNLEVTNAENELRTAQANYYDAVYLAIVAKIDYLKALGLLTKENLIK
jgi:outer membrane protein